LLLQHKKKRKDREQMSNNPLINNALFQFCQMADDGPRAAPSTADRPARSAEDLQWLRDAIQSVEAPERTVKRLLTTIVDAADVSDELLAALEDLSDTVEDLNWAVEFSLMKGQVVVLRALESPLAAKSSDVRRLLAMIMAHAVQQNDVVQKCFSSAKWADIVLPKAVSEEDPQVLAALLHACSCMCREYEAGALEFVAAGGMRLLEALLQHDNVRSTEKVVQRALFLVQYFADVGVSSEQLIRALAGRMTAATSTAPIASSAAAALLSTYRRSPDAVKPLLKPLTGANFAESVVGLEPEDPRLVLKTLLDQN
jgi:hypothetical protein